MVHQIDQDVLTLNEALALPVLYYGIVQSLAVRIRAEPGRVEILYDIGAFRRETVRIASLTAVDAALRQLDHVTRVADFFVLKKLFFDF
jgi:hypothetical protein